MKRMYLFVFSILFIASCKDDDEKTLSVEGTWLAVKEVVSGCNNADYNGTTNYDANGCVGNHCHQLIFSGDIFTHRISDENGIQDNAHGYDVEGSTLILYYSNDVQVRVPIDGDTLTITTSNEDTGCTAVTTYTRKKS